MLSLKKRLKLLQTLGETINSLPENHDFASSSMGISGLKILDDAIKRSKSNNNWFTDESLHLSFKGIGRMLQSDELEQFAAGYNLTENENPKTIGVVMAGNIPLVGFHDFLCVFLSGNRFLGKLSTDDPLLLPGLFALMTDIEPDFREYIQVTTNKITDFQAIIATGSNNTARYFEFYFGKYPHIIRKNRNSLAILNGSESNEDLAALSMDIFAYFGLGCRNVSKVILPEDFPIEKLLDSFNQYDYYAQHHKYFNNYEYNKALLLINQISHHDNGFALFVPQTQLASPVSVIHYQTYRSPSEIDSLVLPYLNEIQCIVSNFEQYSIAVKPGQAQFPALNDYADGIDTMNFLINLP